MQPIKLLVATLALAATAALAQPPSGSTTGPGAPGPGGPDGHGFGGPRFGGGPPGPNLERLSVLLDLDPYQKQEVERVLTEQRATMQAERKAHQGTGERPSFADMQAHREQVRDDTVAKLQNILTDLQITKFKLLMEPPAGGPGGRRGPPRSGDAPAPAAGVDGK